MKGGWQREWEQEVVFRRLLQGRCVELGRWQVFSVSGSFLLRYLSCPRLWIQMLLKKKCPGNSFIYAFCENWLLWHLLYMTTMGGMWQCLDCRMCQSCQFLTPDIGLLLERHGNSQAGAGYPVKDLIQHQIPVLIQIYQTSKSGISSLLVDSS